MRFETFTAILGMVLISLLAHALCSVDEVLVKGRVDYAPPRAKVRVQLVYAKGLLGESGEATIENGLFSIAIEFLTQSRRPMVNGAFEKCGKTPKTVIVMLMGSDLQHEVDRVTLDFAKDFVMADPSAYRLRSVLVLNGTH